MGTGCGPWYAVSSANPSTTYDRLNGVAAIPSTNTAWAVGVSGVANIATQPLVERWDGSSWSAVATPAILAASFAELDGVAVISAMDAWAVGNSSPTVIPGLGTQPLIERWDGVNWSLVPGAPVTNGGFLNAVTALSASDVRAVGSVFDTFGLGLDLAEHWNGASWSIVPMAPPPPIDSELQEFRSVAAVSPTDIWAVGRDRHVAADTGTDAQIEHWDGRSWSLVTSPRPPDPLANTVFNGVVALSTTNVWAVGWAGSSEAKTFVVHWNGTSWSIVSSPNVASKHTRLTGIAAVSANALWAVGFTITEDVANRLYQTVVERWDGVQWRIVPSQNPLPLSSGGNALLGVAATPMRTLRVVGYTENTGATVDQTLIEHSPPLLGIPCVTHA